MNGLESIKQKISADCDAECKRIAADADAECKRILAAAEFSAAKIKADSDAKAEAEIADKKRTSESAASLEIRKETLAAKQALISEAFSRAVAALAASEPEKQKELLVGLALRCEINGGETLRLCKSAAKLYGASVADEVNKRLGAAKLTAGEPTDEIASGFLIQSENSRQICSYEALTELYREELEPVVAGILFEE